MSSKEPRELYVVSNNRTPDEWKAIADARMKECPYRSDDGKYCTRYSGCTGFCDGACAFVVDYIRCESRKTNSNE